MIYPTDFRLLIVRPTLQAMGLHSPEMEDLLIGTAVAETKIEHLRSGDRFGLFGMTQQQHDDLWARFLPSQTYVLSKMLNHCQIHRKPPFETLIYHLTYACAMASLIYYRDPEPVPKDLEGQAAYYKRVYTSFAETDIYIQGYEKLCQEDSPKRQNRSKKINSTP